MFYAGLQYIVNIFPGILHFWPYGIAKLPLVACFSGISADALMFCVTCSFMNTAYLHILLLPGNTVFCMLYSREVCILRYEDTVETKQSTKRSLHLRELLSLAVHDTL